MKKTAAILLLLLSACTVQKQQANVPDMPPLSRDAVWQLVAIRGKEVTKSTNITLTINPETSTISGQSACNRYSANYTLNGNSLSTSNIQLTKIQCPEPDMLAEERYITFIKKADAISWTAYELTLFQHNREILRFEIQ